MRLGCGCEPVWLTSRSVTPDAAVVVARGCPCCEVPGGKRCAGASGGTVEASDKRPGFSWTDVCPARVDEPLVLL